MRPVAPREAASKRATPRAATARPAAVVASRAVTTQHASATTAASRAAAAAGRAAGMRASEGGGKAANSRASRRPRSPLPPPAALPDAAAAAADGAVAAAAAAAATASAGTAAHAALSSALGFVPPMCFTADCQANANRSLLLTLAVPLAAAAAALAWLLRPVPKELQKDGKVFEDPGTGIVFSTPEGGSPARDQQGELAWRVVSYTPWPVDEDYEGDRLRIDVGQIKNRQPRTFVFPRILPQPSALVSVTLPRPMGVVLEWDERRERAFVADLVDGSAAKQRSKMASLDRDLVANVVLPGDILRAVTCTNFVYPTKALFGINPPERHIVVYCADKQKFGRICAAMRKGEVKDGSVTLVVERRLPREAATAAV